MDKIKSTEIVSKIFTIRGIQVMLDFHIAEFFNVETKRLNEQVKRNEKRFPKHFMFQSVAICDRKTKNITLCLYRTRCCDAVFRT